MPGTKALEGIYVSGEAGAPNPESIIPSKAARVLGAAIEMEAFTLEELSLHANVSIRDAINVTESYRELFDRAFAPRSFLKGGSFFAYRVETNSRRRLLRTLKQLMPADTIWIQPSAYESSGLPGLISAERSIVAVSDEAWKGPDEKARVWRAAINDVRILKQELVDAGASHADVSPNELERLDVLVASLRALASRPAGVDPAFQKAASNAFQLIEQTVQSYRDLGQPGRIGAREVSRSKPELIDQYRGRYWTKRLCDLVLGGPFLFLISPLLLVVALAIKFDSQGPVLFRQRRVGYNGRTFMIVKFRTMAVVEDGGEIRQALRDDRRITRLGRWLRVTGVYELPTLLNVIRGEMSLVGPRPLSIVHDNEHARVLRDYMLRYGMRPGMTSLAHADNPFESLNPGQLARRLQLDIEYIENWSLWLDIKILVRTIVSSTRGVH